MSRIGKKQIIIPVNTDVTVSGSTVTVKGSHGTIVRDFSPVISFAIADGKVTVSPMRKDLSTKALWGTYSAHLLNMISGVNTLFQKKLIIEGIGFKAEVKGDELVMNLGFSHPVKIKIPKGLKVISEKGVITVSGTDTELVGQFTAYIRDQKKPEPYKGKGIRYDNEVIRRKQGKKTA